MTAETQPLHITANRAAGLLHIEWADHHNSRYGLTWLRANCPCATCREERNKAAQDMLRLMSGPLPSAELVDIEFVGRYALRIDWADGHNTGIFPFNAMRTCCPCQVCNPNGPPPLLID